MPRIDSSPTSSPARKRQRLSSPTYDEQLGDISQEDIEAFDALEAKFSQSSNYGSRDGSQEGRDRRVRAIAHALNQDMRGSSFPPEAGRSSQLYHSDHDAGPRLADDPDNPFTSGFRTAKSSSTGLPSITPLSMTESSTVSARASALVTQDYERSPSPEVPPEPDFDSWFLPTSSIPPVAFQSAAILPTAEIPLSSLGFTTASKKGLLAPSSEALAKAREKMKDIWQDVDKLPIAVSPSAEHTPHSVDGIENTFRTASATTFNSSPKRPALRPLDNSLNSPSTPATIGFSRPPTIPRVSSPSPMVAGRRPKPFKSPLLTPQMMKTMNGAVGSPLNPSRNPGLPMFSTVGSHHPLSGIPITSIMSPFASTSAITSATPTRDSGITEKGGPGHKRSIPAPFVTPFKAGMKPGQPGRLQLEELSRTSQSARVVSSPSEKSREDWLTRERPGVKGKGIGHSSVFDLAKQLNRKSLASSGLSPQEYTYDELESMGINVTELAQISPSLAMYYSFHTSTTTPVSTIPLSGPYVVLGPERALEELLDHGCSLATKPWVDNHWCLILWKLAGMVALDPERESRSTEKRWCWTEVMRQLLYRYERELKEGARPPFRLIATQDAPAAYPMMLCVSNVTWSEGGLTDDGMPIEPYPELEVTDGWYRLRAQVDAPLARAIRRRVIRIGRKIGVAGARLSSERKDPSEIFEAYNSTKLVLYGNSSHLVPWHAKLGFQTGPCISTLHSLTSDGGLVACMDVFVLKTYPVAFLEHIEDENGQTHREGPRNEAEEAQIDEQWKKRRELEVSKLRLELDEKSNRFEGYIDRLERRSGSGFRPSEDDSSPDNIDDLYDELEDPTEAGRTISRVSPREAGWLARHIRYQLDKEREDAGEEIECQLKTLCPPRDVRNFRVLIVQDARTHRRPANRRAQLTVWDVLNLSLSEGTAAGTFNVGQRYLVTNLIPTQQKAWMDCEPGSDVYLSTRRDSRWTPIKH